MPECFESYSVRDPLLVRLREHQGRGEENIGRASGPGWDGCFEKVPFVYDGVAACREPQQ